MSHTPDAKVELDLAIVERLVRACIGLGMGSDWNNGTHAKKHGYRKQLLDALLPASEALARLQDWAALEQSDAVMGEAGVCKMPNCSKKPVWMGVCENHRDWLQNYKSSPPIAPVQDDDAEWLRDVARWDLCTATDKERIEHILVRLSRQAGG